MSRLINEMGGSGPSYDNPPPLQERPETEGDIAHNTDEDPRDSGVHIPEGYESVEEFLKEAREEFALDLEADRDNRDEGLEDLAFLAGDQWDAKAKHERERDGRPCMTVNTLPQFVGQVIGDRRLNRTMIRAIPVENADAGAAEIRSGLIRGVEVRSKASRVYDAALEDQVGGGIGNFRITMEYANDDVFEQDIFVRQIGNAFSVVWDRFSLDPTGRDAQRCFVQDVMPRKDYEARWPDKPIPVSLGDMGGETSFFKAGWVDSTHVRVTEYWRIKEREVQVCMLADGSVVDYTPGSPQNVAIHPATQQPMIRTTRRKYACMYLITGFDILEGPYELPLDRLPIIRVNGREVRIGERRVRFGLIRWARDPVRMRNYWRSIAVETLAMAPKNQWLAQRKSVKGIEEDFREAHLTNDPLLVYNDNTDAPTRAEGPQLPAAVLQEVAMNTQDIKDTTGLQDASLGIRSNEVSGKAIMARQQEGDVATIVYHDNLNAAIEEAGNVINQLIPVCYDTVRTLRVVGEDEKSKLIVANDPNNPEAVPVTKGKYDLELVTGPSYTTQRQYAADAMLEFTKVAPEMFPVIGDLLVEAQDWPKAPEIVERLRKAVIPKELTKDPDEPPTQEEMQAAQEQAEQAQLQATAAAEAAELQTKQAEQAIQEKDIEIQIKEQELRRAHAEADKAESDAERAELELNADTIRIPGEIMASGGRPQMASENGNSSAAISGSQSGRQPRRNKKR